MTLNVVPCIATGANQLSICKNNKRNVGTGVQPRLGENGVNSGNEVHSNKVTKFSLWEFLHEIIYLAMLF